MPTRWCNSAQLRRYQIESGLDLTFNEVFKPLISARVSELRPSRVLEVGAGTGHMAKAISSLGSDVTAIEPSHGMFTVAREVLRDDNVRLLNCTSFDLPFDAHFDLAYTHLVAHVIDDLIGFFGSIGRHLVPGGNFIFSIPHPCFYNSYKGLFGDEYKYTTPIAKDIVFTITKDPDNSISGVPYHHRPLSSYINSAIGAGFLISHFDEIMPTAEVQSKYGEPWNEPRYCIFTCAKL